MRGITLLRDRDACSYNMSLLKRDLLPTSPNKEDPMENFDFNCSIVEALQAGYSIEALLESHVSQYWKPSGNTDGRRSIEVSDFSPIRFNTNTSRKFDRVKIRSGEVLFVNKERTHYWILPEEVGPYGEDDWLADNYRWPDGELGTRTVPAPVPCDEDTGWWGSDGYRDR